MKIRSMCKVFLGTGVLLAGILGAGDAPLFGQAIAPEAVPPGVNEYDVATMSRVAKTRNWTFKVGETWVTRYLREGGSVESVTGLSVPLDWKEGAAFANIESRSDLPASFDWRARVEGGLQPARNQGNCGSCWAFSVAATLESLQRIAHPEAPIDFSEQAVLSCSGSGSCGGGYFSAFNYLKKPGLANEAQFTYRASNLRCPSNLSPKAKIAQWTYIGSGKASPTTAQLKTAIMTYGPISVTVNGSFSSYSSGVYNACNNSKVNHMVNIEGWSDEGGGYWIMRNSWGAKWGEKGYMRIRYTDRNGRKCNRIGETAAFAILVDEPESKKAL